MPRTATAEQHPVTFMTGVEREVIGPDYHFFTRVVGAQSNPQAGVISGDELDMQVTSWLLSGYKVAHIDMLRTVEIPGQSIAGFQFGYHLIRE